MKYIRHKIEGKDLLGKPIIKVDKIYKNEEQLYKDFPKLKDNEVHRRQMKLHLEGKVFYGKYTHKNNGEQYQRVQRHNTYQGYVWKVED